MSARPQPSVALAAALQRAIAKAEAIAGKLVLAQRAAESTPEYQLATDMRAAFERFKAARPKRGRHG